TLTIGAGVTVHGFGQVSRPYYYFYYYSYFNPVTLDNQGTLTADEAGQTLSVSAEAVTNEGTLSARNGASLIVNGLSGNLNAATVTDTDSSLTVGGPGYVVNQNLTAPLGTTLTLNGAWSVAAGTTIVADGGTVNLGGDSTLPTAQAVQA